MPQTIQVVGTRVPTAGVAELRPHLLEIAGRRPSRMAVLTAYFGPETFEVLDDLTSAGVSAIDVVLGANGASRNAWEAARDYALAPSGAVDVRVARSAPGSILHPKLVLAEFRRRRCAILGSSNFTAGGLWGNVEL